MKLNRTALLAAPTSIACANRGRALGSSRSHQCWGLAPNCASQAVPRPVRNDSTRCASAGIAVAPVDDFNTFETILLTSRPVAAASVSPPPPHMIEPLVSVGGGAKVVWSRRTAYTCSGD